MDTPSSAIAAKSTALVVNHVKCGTDYLVTKERDKLLINYQFYKSRIQTLENFEIFEKPLTEFDQISLLEI